MNQKIQSKSNLLEFIEEWNSKHPYDRWWRKKYNVPFGSKIHKETNHIDMTIEYKEDLYFKRLNDRKTINEFKAEEGTLISEIVALKQDKLSTKQSKSDIDNDFANLDLSQFNGPIEIEK